MSERRVLKWTLEPGVTEILTADAPRFLAAGVRGEHVVVWAEATAGDGPQVSHVAAVMTGEQAPTYGAYIGTAQLPSGIVVHVYQLVAR